MITTLSVTKFNSIVRDIFNNEELLHSVNVVGEVFGISRAKTAIYFSIKDEESTLPCVCFYPSAFEGVKEGDLVTLSGGPNYYTKSGRFNYVAHKITPAGQGLLFQRFVELKNKLESEGLFDVALKKQLPKTIKRIGVVTSKDGAVIQDIKNVTWRRNPSVEIVLYNTKVQGNGAEKEICEGINFFSQYDKVDVVIVARGGGSLEDLSAYNTECVARATFDCQKPIISAVGHETDFTIIDFVSDLRAPTPSAAAELVTQDTSKEKETLKMLTRKLIRELNLTTINIMQMFEHTISTLATKISDFIEERRVVIEDNSLKLSNLVEKLIDEEKHKLELKENILKRIDPREVLRRGYAKIEQSGKNVDRADEVLIGEKLEINFIDGKIIAKSEERI